MFPDKSVLSISNHMRTKLVYVLTCAPEKIYIEQALMAVYSARHWNPDAHIVLITDDETDKLFVDGRAEIIKYISEKIVVPFGAGEDMMYRSRWIKTSVRQLVDGDFLFVDCDTIVCKDLSEVDALNCELAMVLDSHLETKYYDRDLFQTNVHNSSLLSWSFENESKYFNSGVIYSKDTTRNRYFFKRWHDNWLLGMEKGLKIDQTSLGLTNIQEDHLICQLPDEWNCQMYMRPLFVHDAYIMHFWSFRNESFMFGPKFLSAVREKGMNEYVKKLICNPLKSEIPFKNERSLYGLLDNLKMLVSMRQQLKEYSRYVDSQFVDFPWMTQFSNNERKLLKKHCFLLVALLFTMRSFVSINLLNKKDTSIVSFH